MITKKTTLETEKAFALGGLLYIAASPYVKQGKFGFELVKIARKAIQLIQRLSKQNENLKRHIRYEALIANSCTFCILGEICENCDCIQKPKKKP